VGQGHQREREGEGYRFRISGARQWVRSGAGPDWCPWPVFTYFLFSFFSFSDFLFYSKPFHNGSK
jgi:hypothetical protein